MFSSAIGRIAFAFSFSCSPFSSSSSFCNACSRSADALSSLSTFRNPSFTPRSSSNCFCSDITSALMLLMMSSGEESMYDANFAL